MADIGYPTEMLATRRATSDEAYASAELAPSRATVLRLLRERPQTCDELMQAHDLQHQSASAAVNWLMRNGFVIDSGERRNTRTGRSAIVWRAVSHPVPIKDERPTRRELERRIEDAVALAHLGAPIWEILKVLEPDSR